MARKFADAVVGHDVIDPVLPLVHTTSGPAFEFYIAESDTLAARSCGVYSNADLAYLFYGKPSYRPKDADEKHRDMLQFAPVCLVIDAPRGMAPKRILPFDSGAYHDGIVAREGHAHRALPKEFFELPDMDAARAVVGVFFGSNLAYFDERPRSPLPIDKATNTCVESYVSLISRTGTNEGDSRLSSIEVQFDQNIPLAGNVLAVALAEPFFENREEIREKIKIWGAEPLLYPLDGRYTAGECCATINRMVRGFIERQGRF